MQQCIWRERERDLVYVGLPVSVERYSTVTPMHPGSKLKIPFREIKTLV